jgi:hypothetical protein
MFFLLAAGILNLPALTVMLFLRTRLGVRTLNTAFLPLLGFCLLAAGLVASTTLSGGKWMSLFAVVMLIAASITSWRRWYKLLKGEVWHTYSRGLSRFAWLPLPTVVVHAIIDPLVVALVALLIGLTVSTMLGAWLAFAAFSLFATEVIIFGFQLERYLDTMDARLNAEYQTVEFADLTGRLEMPKGKAAILDSAKGAPVTLATGIGDDLKRKLAEKTPLTSLPDDLLPPAVEKVA